MKKMVSAALLCGLSAWPGTAIGADRFDDWQAGDLVFMESASMQAVPIRVATGSAYTHMGIVDVTDEGPRVIEAGATVVEVSAADFVARGVGGNFSVYRIAGLAPEDAAIAVAEARTYLGRPYDIFFRLDPSAIYCSELPFYAFHAVDIELGKVEKLGDLNIDSPEARQVFLDRWDRHPDCMAEGLDRDGCWELIQVQDIVTPVSIAEGANVDLIYSTFYH